jgi:hypothetical protein
MKKVDMVLKRLQSKTSIKRTELSEMLGGGRNVTSLIQVLQKKWYVIKIEYDNYANPVIYELVEYKQPFYQIARNIQHRYPEFEEAIREEYARLMECWEWEKSEIKEGVFEKLKSIIL